MLLAMPCSLTFAKREYEPKGGDPVVFFFFFLFLAKKEIELTLYL